MIADDETDPRRLVPCATLPDVSSGALGRLRSTLDLRRAARAVSGATAAATAAATSAASVAAAAAASGLRLGRALGTPQPADPSDWTVARLRA
ncbi:MAG: hypothetical protein MUE98_15335, partial [Rhodobacteraceae bacterium]|nr:hypothetical protein [Paracoccaceae bacterium]